MPALQPLMSGQADVLRYAVRRRRERPLADRPGSGRAALSRARDGDAELGTDVWLPVCNNSLPLILATSATAVHVRCLDGRGPSTGRAQASRGSGARGVPRGRGTVLAKAVPPVLLPREQTPVCAVDLSSPLSKALGWPLHCSARTDRGGPSFHPLRQARGGWPRAGQPDYSSTRATCSSSTAPRGFQHLAAGVQAFVGQERGRRKGTGGEEAAAATRLTFLCLLSPHFIAAVTVRGHSPSTVNNILGWVFLSRLSPSSIPPPSLSLR